MQTDDFRDFFREVVFGGYFSQMDERGVNGRVALVSRRATSLISALERMSLWECLTRILADK